MSRETEALVLDLVEWVAKKPRPYTDVMEAWRTSCPRLTIWEDAQDKNLIRRFRNETGVTVVAATEDGRQLLQTSGRR
jgi:hypothetical protein